MRKGEYWQEKSRPHFKEKSRKYIIFVVIYPINIEGVFFVTLEGGTNY